MGRAGTQLTLLDVGTELPNGFLYKPHFLTEAEEEVLCAYIENLPLEHPIYNGAYEAKRRIQAFGWTYDFKNRRLIPGPPLPPFLRGIQQKIAKWLDIPVQRVVHALVTEYMPTTAIGWHVDTEEFEHVIGISLGSWCTMRLRSLKHKEVMALALEPRSVYVMQGDVRFNWQHSILPTKALRYSITFRTLPGR